MIKNTDRCAVAKMVKDYNRLLEMIELGEESMIKYPHLIMDQVKYKSHKGDPTATTAIIREMYDMPNKEEINAAKAVISTIDKAKKNIPQEIWLRIEDKFIFTGRGSLGKNFACDINLVVRYEEYFIRKVLTLTNKKIMEKYVNNA